MASREPLPTAADGAADVVDGALFRDVVQVHAARVGLDRALLAALRSPGLGELEVARVVALAQGPQMRRGRAAWHRLQQATGLPDAPTSNSTSMPSMPSTTTPEVS